MRSLPDDRLAEVDAMIDFVLDRCDLPSRLRNPVRERASRALCAVLYLDGLWPSERRL